MWLAVVGGIAGLVIGYLVVNGKRNSDPLNRKCAAEICEYIVSESERLKPERINDIFMGNARYRSQALHVVSMVPVLLQRAGVPREEAMSVVPSLNAVAFAIPK